jgi:RHS repeat-associated protein
MGIGSETKSGSTTFYTRTPGGKLISQRLASGTRYFYLFDGQGSVVALVDSAGTIQAQYGYDPYGQTVTKTGSAADGNPFRYTGAYLDSTGYYKLGARYYDPARGRWLQLDPLGGGYIYASDDPVNLIDPTGLDDCPNGDCGGGGYNTSTPAAGTPTTGMTGGTNSAVNTPVPTSNPGGGTTAGTATPTVPVPVQFPDDFAQRAASGGYVIDYGAIGQRAAVDCFDGMGGSLVVAVPVALAGGGAIDPTVLLTGCVGNVAWDAAKQAAQP